MIFLFILYVDIFFENQLQKLKFHVLKFRLSQLQISWNEQNSCGFAYKFFQNHTKSKWLQNEVKVMSRYNHKIRLEYSMTETRQNDIILRSSWPVCSHWVLSLCYWYLTHVSSNRVLITFVLIFELIRVPLVVIKVSWNYY